MFNLFQVKQFTQIFELACAEEMKQLVCAIYVPICMPTYHKFLPPCRYGDIYADEAGFLNQGPLAFLGGRGTSTRGPQTHDLLVVTSIQNQRTAVATMNEIPTKIFVAEQGATAVKNF